ncbi:helix-hairpin-helix domain-containing protein [Leucobacter sp. wl10]|uniref:helix-hairpin-helix domain-containing protein n=1 Tax=Leucobacter sp. wl10 TaxID=2304677 RepID=UPI000E5C52BA|nr:helix-hairpin-helix domain-containing protein [Leucobacter sp. wl10]RGE20098.1 helix-hairpin-helix domain-containing protein [Leucobacter sp. wl10]
MEDRGPVFDGIRIGRPATGALIEAGYASVEDLPDDLAQLLHLHGVGPTAVKRLGKARAKPGGGGR